MKTHALRLSRTKNLHYANATFPRFSANEWPFNTQTNGYVAVCRYIDQMLDANPKQAVRVLGGIESAKKLISGDGVERPVERIFQRVEMDAHKIDGRFCVMVPNNVGDYTAPFKSSEQFAKESCQFCGHVFLLKFHNAMIK